MSDVVNLFGIFAICLTTIFCCICIGLRFYCKPDNPDDRVYSGYRVAVSNRLFKVSN